MTNKIKFYKVAAMPTNLTAANNGIYFVKGTGSAVFKMYIVNNGVSVELDAASLAALALKADDSAVVHKTGNETVAGTKTFSAPIVASTAPTLGTHLTNKTYVDGKDSALQTQIDDLSAAIQQGMRTPTDIDCSTNPNYPISAKGATYIVTKLGKIGGASGVDVEVGDMIICKTATTAAGTHAEVGANFFILQTNLKQATETIAGFAKIATQALTNSGTDDTSFVTPKKLATKLAATILELDSKFVKYDGPQTLTPAQQTQVRTNLNVPSKTEAVLLAGAQTISGAKTFSVVPKSSADAVGNTDLVRLSQVKTLVADADITWSTEDWA